jgi:hypothetical protein
VKSTDEFVNPEFPWKSLSSAKEFRRQARECLKSLKSGWGYYFWGNCGETEFALDQSALTQDEEIEHSGLRNSDSK